MTQPNLLELAKQADPQAIAALMNRSLQTKGITATVMRQGDSLWVNVKSAQIPNRQALTTFVQKGFANLGIRSVKSIHLVGQSTQSDQPAWTQEILLQPVIHSSEATATPSAEPAAAPQEPSPPLRPVPPPVPPFRPASPAPQAPPVAADGVYADLLSDQDAAITIPDQWEEFDVSPNHLIELLRDTPPPSEPHPADEGLSDEPLTHPGTAALSGEPIDHPDLDPIVSDEPLPDDHPDLIDHPGTAALSGEPIDHPDDPLDISQPIDVAATPVLEETTGQAAVSLPTIPPDVPRYEVPDGEMAVSEEDATTLPDGLQAETPDREVADRAGIPVIPPDVPRYEVPDGEMAPVEVASNGGSATIPPNIPRYVVADGQGTPAERPIRAEAAPVESRGTSRRELIGYTVLLAIAAWVFALLGFAYWRTRNLAPVASPSPAVTTPAQATAPASPSPAASPAVPSPGISAAPNAASPEADPLQAAIARADQAAALAGSAQSADDWQLVVSQWQEAIALLGTIPSNNPNYAEAQQRLAEFQGNLATAQQSANQPIGEDVAPPSTPVTVTNAGSCPAVETQPNSQPLELTNVQFDRNSGEQGNFVVGCITNHSDQPIANVLLSFQGTSTENASVSQPGVSSLEVTNLQPGRTVPFRSALALAPEVTNVQIESISWTPPNSTESQQVETSLSLER